jgi:hypothetical protein
MGSYGLVESNWMGRMKSRVGKSAKFSTIYNNIVRDGYVLGWICNTHFVPQALVLQGSGKCLFGDPHSLAEHCKHNILIEMAISA